jgi:aminomethyltransferase
MQTDIHSSPQPIQRTALHPHHVALGAHFTLFAGWELPLYYCSILKEHLAVRLCAGLFDISHLGHLEVFGEGADAQLQRLVTSDIAKLAVGQACYTSMLTPRGSILDEMIVYRLGLKRFRLVANAARAERVLGWLRTHLISDVQIEDRRSKVGTLALQGPKAVGILSAIVDFPVASLARYGIAEIDVVGWPVWVARTGYTGEDGFELFCTTEALGPIWLTLLKAGEGVGLKPAGLGARDTLRLEMGLPLGGSDLDEDSTPLEVGLERTIDWDKGPFIGRDALERQRQEGVRRLLVGFELKEPGVARGGYPIYAGNDRIGEVTSGGVVPSSYSQADAKCTWRAIGLGYVRPQWARPGTEIAIEIHGRLIKAQVVQCPFYHRKRSAASRSAARP